MKRMASYCRRVSNSNDPSTVRQLVTVRMASNNKYNIYSTAEFLSAVSGGRFRKAPAMRPQRCEVCTSPGSGTHRRHRGRSTETTL